MDKARGWDKLSIRMITTSGGSITFPLKLIFKSMINEVVFPEDWKKSNVVPIHKKGSKNLIKNYRPISLLLIFSKVFQRLVFNTLTSFCKINYSPPANRLYTRRFLCFAMIINYTWNLWRFWLPPTHRYEGYFPWYLKSIW